MQPFKVQHIQCWPWLSSNFFLEKKSSLSKVSPLVVPFNLLIFCHYPVVNTTDDFTRRPFSVPLVPIRDVCAQRVSLWGMCSAEQVKNLNAHQRVFV